MWAHHGPSEGPVEAPDNMACQEAIYNRMDVMRQHTSPIPSYPIHTSRAEELERDFLAYLAMISQNKARLLPPGFLADYQAFGWIEMRNGVPCPTDAGMQAARHMSRPHHAPARR